MMGGSQVTRYGLLGGIIWGLAWVVRTVIKTVILVMVRYTVGLPLHGHRSTDATFTDDGVQGVGKPAFWGRREPTRWALMAGWKRAAVRWVAPGLVLGVVVAWLRWPVATRWTLTVAAGAALGYAGWWLFERARIRHHMTRYVNPLHVVLGPQLGVDEKWRPSDWLTVPVDFREQHAVIRVKLPPGFFTGGSDDDSGRRLPTGPRAMVDGVVCEKLGLSRADVSATYRMVGDEPCVEYRHVERPPQKVTVEDVQELLEAATGSNPLIGLGSRHTPVSVDRDSESPHTLLSMAPGAGKSIFARGVIAQDLHAGGQVVIFDVKRTSHRWVRGLPGVTYCRDAEDIHEALLGLLTECDRRNALIDAEGDAAEVGPRITIVAEEMNACIRRLQKHWDRVRSSKDRKVSPAVDALGELLFMGREPKINVLGIAQLATAGSLGGNEARENFSTRVLGRYTQNAWRMLVPEVQPIPKASKLRGRVQVVIAGEATETQVVYWSEEQARAWAMEGEAVSTSHLPAELFSRGEHGETVSGTTPASGALTRENANSSTRETVQRGHLSVVPDPAAEPQSTPAQDKDREEQKADDGADAAESPEPHATSTRSGELVTLKEAADRELVTVSDDPRKALMILRAARRRDPEFPKPSPAKRGSAQVFAVADLQRWQRNRPRSESAS